jgi:hypothetical protein
VQYLQDGPFLHISINIVVISPYKVRDLTGFYQIIPLPKTLPKVNCQILADYPLQHSAGTFIAILKNKA